MFAIIETGGKQYRVEEGQTLVVEKLDAEGAVVFDRVLLVSGDGGTKVGTPYLAGAKVAANVQGETKGKKLDVVKFKSKVRYRRKIGHRQHYTKVTIGTITA